jgi:hypothetical protein
VVPALLAVTRAVIRVVMLVEHVSSVPPLFPVPLHWLTRTGIAGLIRDADATVHLAVEPPPVTEPLHWVTVAPVVVAGYGLQSRGPVAPYLPPPVPVPTHWLTVAALTGRERRVPALMLLVMTTRQVTRGGAASLAEALHWLTRVTSLVDRVVNVPLPPGHGPSRQVRFRVVVEPRKLPRIVLTTVTVQVSVVVAPAGVPSTPLHWLTVLVVAAWAALGGRAIVTARAAARNARKASEAWRGVVRAGCRAGAVTRDTPSERRVAPRIWSVYARDDASRDAGSGATNKVATV